MSQKAKELTLTKTTSKATIYRCLLTTGCNHSFLALCLVRSLIEEHCSLLQTSRPGTQGIVPPHLSAPAEQDVPVADQPQLNSGLLGSEANNPEAQTQLEQHCQTQGQNHILNHSS